MDDNEMVREIVATALKDGGYSVEMARDGEEALAIYAKAQQSARPFDAVIMDLIVPGGMGGEEATRKLLHLDPDAKVIVSSGYCNDPTWADYRRYGFSGVIANHTASKI
jgi:two-component system, cell cycle sensor histidine kinase and response regulator CckA